MNRKEVMPSGQITRSLTPGHDVEIELRPHGRTHSRQKRQDENTEQQTKYYSALAENWADKEANEEAQKFIEKTLEGKGRVVVLKKGETEDTIGWGALELDEKSIQALKDHPAIKNVTEEDYVQKRLKPRQPEIRLENKGIAKHDKRTDWDQLRWYGDSMAADTLTVVSQYE
jgi:hypothetical protein